MKKKWPKLPIPKHYTKVRKNARRDTIIPRPQILSRTVTGIEFGIFDCDTTSSVTRESLRPEQPVQPEKDLKQDDVIPSFICEDVFEETIIQGILSTNVEKQSSNLSKIWNEAKWLRPVLIKQLLAQNIILPGSCCSFCQEMATSRCRCCARNLLYCEDCIVIQHKNVYSKCILTANSKNYCHVTNLTSNIMKSDNHDSCPSKYEKILMLVSYNSSNMTRTTFCNCSGHSETEQLIEYGFWPDNPSRPGICINIDLLELYRGINLAAHTPMKAFIKMLEFHQGSNNSLPSSIYNKFRLVYYEYRACMVEIESMTFLKSLNKANLNHEILAFIDTHQMVYHLYRVRSLRTLRSKCRLTKSRVARREKKSVVQMS